MQIPFKHIAVSPGSQAILRGLGWRDFKALLEETGEHRAARYAYRNKTLKAFRQAVKSRLGGRT